MSICPIVYLSLVLMLTFLGAPARPECVPPPPATAASIVVLELFTSQGCSSCPPAERVLNRIGRDDRLRDHVVPLAFHVDYWNHDGWSDPFSSSAWSARQEAYARQLSPDSIYTPQLVVDGRTQLNGSDEAGVLRAIDAAAAAARACRVAVTATPDGARRLAVDICVESREAVDARKLDAIVVVTESGITTAVGRGENSGKTLESDFVVRRLSRAFSFEPTAGVTRSERVTVGLDRDWSAANVGVVAFVQDPDTMKIYGAAAR